VGTIKLKRSGPLEVEQEKCVRRLNTRKGKVGDWTGVDRKKRNLDASGFWKF
jgi:hypothetical protein